jgi:hypothetical protein
MSSAKRQSERSCYHDTATNIRATGKAPAAALLPIHSATSSSPAFQRVCRRRHAVCQQRDAHAGWFCAHQLMASASASQVRTNEWDLDRDCDLLRAHITEQMASVLEPGSWRLIETIQVGWHDRLAGCHAACVSALLILPPSASQCSQAGSQSPNRCGFCLDLQCREAAATRLDPGRIAFQLLVHCAVQESINTVATLVAAGRHAMERGQDSVQAAPDYAWEA